jgi:GNAT superfamily N-acetyltransferase
MKWKTQKKKKQKRKRKTRYGGAQRAHVAPDITFTETGNGHTDVFCVVEGQEVGNAHLHRYNNEMTLENLQVNAYHKGKGIGTRMLKAILEYAFEQDIDKVTLTDLTGSAQFNPTGIPNKMYEKAGFVCSNPGIPYCKNDLELTRAQYERTKNSKRSRSRNRT